VFLAGWYQQEELPDLLAAADAVVTASEREQFGQVLVEGMACGLPVVAPRSLGPALIVDHGKTGWLTDPDDQSSLVRAIIEVVENPVERARRGAAARAAALSRYSWIEISARFGGVLEELVGKRPALSAADAATKPQG
jgi:glycosyltransferase involved in cell wall biosynthesis